MLSWTCLTYATLRVRTRWTTWERLSKTDSRRSCRSITESKARPNLLICLRNRTMIAVGSLDQCPIRMKTRPGLETCSSDIKTRNWALRECLLRSHLSADLRIWCLQRQLSEKRTTTLSNGLWNKTNWVVGDNGHQLMRFEANNRASTIKRVLAVSTSSLTLRYDASKRWT